MNNFCCCCTKYPGRGVMCHTGHKHATAHAKPCEHFSEYPQPNPKMLRLLAIAMHRAGHMSKYQRLIYAWYRLEAAMLAETGTPHG